MRDIIVTSIKYSPGLGTACLSWLSCRFQSWAAWPNCHPSLQTFCTTRRILNKAVMHIIFFRKKDGIPFNFVTKNRIQYLCALTQGSAGVLLHWPACVFLTNAFAAYIVLPINNDLHT